MDWLGPLFQTELGFGTVLVRLIAAVVLGAVIGFEREYLARPAGLRTHILVSLAAALFTVVALELAHREIAQSQGLSIDPTRVVEAVTAGVAFLAAGSIIRGKGGVKGLTTGAGLWLAGAIGTACGIGTIGIAAIVAGIGLIVLTVFRLLERDLPHADGSAGDQKRE